MSDPDHLNGFNIIALYSHWLKRQQNRLSPFIVLNSSPNHGTIGREPQNSKKGSSLKGKEKMKYIKVDDETEKNRVEEDEEEKEDEEKKEYEEEEEEEEEELLL